MDDIKNLFLSLRWMLETESYKHLFDVLIDRIPDYFWSVPASSTGKHHPNYALEDGGLAKHVYAATYILNDLLRLEYNRTTWDATQRDQMRIAIMFHDCMKSGTQDEYDDDKHTKFDHPIKAAELVRSTMLELNCFDGTEILVVYACIASHMGEFNISSYSDVVLPKPLTPMQMFVHQADFQASRTYLEFNFEKVKTW